MRFPFTRIFRVPADSVTASGSDGVYIYNKSGIAVQDLVFVGSRNGKSHDGIAFMTNGSSQSNFKVNDVDVSGYGNGGVRLMSARYGAGINNVTITNSTLH